MTISAEEEDTDPETAKRQVKDIKDRRHVQAVRGSVSKVVRCRFTEDSRREASLI